MDDIRRLRVEELIRTHIMTLIVRGEIKDPRVPWHVNITRVKIADDLSMAKIYLSSDKGDRSIAAACKGLNSAAGFIRMTLGKVMKSKNTPKPVFFEDENQQKAYEVEKLISQIVVDPQSEEGSKTR
ncbi:MAG: 30S ribosome-binding factor RbfA [Spirochaetia bacterium]